MKETKDVEELYTRLQKLFRLHSSFALLEWDQEVHMPKKGANVRAKVLSEMSSLVHSTLLAINEGDLLERLNDKSEAGELDTDTQIIVREMWKKYERAAKLPDAFVRELNELSSKGMHVWKHAREQNDFSAFSNVLERMVELKRQEADLVGYDTSPYDALIDSYEPDTTSAEIDEIFDGLKTFLIPFVEKVKNITAPSEKMKGVFDILTQQAFNEKIAGTVGFDFEAGYLATSTHPFTHTIAEGTDVRITTRYAEDDVFYALTSTLHEAGHGMYEQGLLEKYRGTPLGEYTSLGIHESQSRFWENQIGRSREFISFILPQLQSAFGSFFAHIHEDDVYRYLNNVTPSYIRTEADEVTYNLHIIIRYEIEKQIFEKNLEVKDLPDIWNAKYKEYLGIDVPDDARGVLQDIHWSMGSFGYFPTYTLGNLYCAQFTAQLLQDVPDMYSHITKGSFEPILKWLRTHIHEEGKRYSSKELVEKVTGTPPHSKAFAEYLEKKFSEI